MRELAGPGGQRAIECSGAQASDVCATICDAHTSMNERILHVLKLEPHDHAIRVAYVVCTEQKFSRACGAQICFLGAFEPASQFLR